MSGHFHPNRKNYPTTSTRVTTHTKLRSNTTNTMPPSPNVWIAASDGDIAAVGQFLVRDPAAVNSHDENGCEYPPHSHPFINGIFLLQCSNYLRSLLRNVNKIKKDTPIHAAVSYNHVSLLKSLVRNHGGNVNVEDHDGDTPLFAAETVEVAKVLVEELGADAGHRNSSGLMVRVSVSE